MSRHVARLTAVARASAEEERPTGRPPRARRGCRQESPPLAILRSCLPARRTLEHASQRPRMSASSPCQRRDVSTVKRANRETICGRSCSTRPPPDESRLERNLRASETISETISEAGQRERSRVDGQNEWTGLEPCNVACVVALRTPSQQEERRERTTKEAQVRWDGVVAVWLVLLVDLRGSGASLT